MRNLKKHLSVLLVLAMVFTMLAPVFAASSYNYEDEAKALYGLGLYKGVSDKNFVPDLGSALTREQSAIILLRLFGQEQEAQALTEGQVNEALARFADAGEVSSWARHQVAYAASTGVIKGIQSENGLVFNPKGALKGIDYASLVLQQLGVKDFDYFGALEKLASLNAITVPQMIAFDKEQLTRDDVVGMSYGVLTAQAENGSTVIENLVEKGLVERAYAEELGLVEKQETPAVDPSTEPSEEPSTEPSEQPVAQAKVEFIPAESRVLSRSQSLFEIGQVQITAADEPVVVTGLKLQRTGISADTVVKSITVWNGNDKVNSIGRFSTGIANIAFTKVVTVPAGQTVKLPIRINVDNNAGVASELKISLLEVKSDTALAGNFPMMGNAFTVAHVDLGTLKVKQSGDAPIANVNAGDKDVRLAKFDFEVGYEAQTIKRIVFSQNGNAADTDLANLKLVDEDGTVLALGEINKGEVAFDLNKDCISGTTARLTLRGDIVGGAGRSIQFSIDNVNDVQSVGKVYGTTIVASNTEDGSKLDIGRGSLILTRSTSSPAASTVASTVDDQKFASIKIEAVGEPIQLETIKVDGTVIEKGLKAGVESAISEIKLVSNGVVIASQEIKSKIYTVNNNDVKGLELPLSEVVTVEPNSPIVVDILVDLKDAGKDSSYTMGITGITGSGLVSEKDITINDKSYGSKMTVGEVKVTFEQEAQVKGYIFPNQSQESIATFNVYHNLGETVRLSSITVQVKKAPKNSDNFVPVTENDSLQNVLNNMRLTSSNGTDISENLRPLKVDNNGCLRFALKEGVTIDSGKTLKIMLVTDVRGDAINNEGERYKFLVSDASAVTTSTGTSVEIKDSKYSRIIEIGEAAKVENIDANYSIENAVKSRNILPETKNVEVARWTLENDGQEAILVNKIYLTAQFKDDLDPSYIRFVLKDGNGKALTNTDEGSLFSIVDEVNAVNGVKTISKDVEINKSGDRSVFIIDAAKNDEPGRKDLVLYANVLSDAKIAGKFSVALGGEEINALNASNEQIKYTIAGSADEHELKEIPLFEITGSVSGITDTKVIAFKTGSGQEQVYNAVKNMKIGDNGYTTSIPNIDAEDLATPIEGGKNGQAAINTISITKLYASNADSTTREITPGTGMRVAKFKVENKGNSAIDLRKITLKRTEEIRPEVGASPAPEAAVSNLRIYRSGNNLGEASFAQNGDEVTITLTNPERIAKGESKEFEVRIGTTDTMSDGHSITLVLLPDKTYYDKAGNANAVYEISLDNTEETVDLGTARAKK